MYKIALSLLALLSFQSICFAQAPTLPMAANPEGIAVLDFKAEFKDGIDSHLTYFKEKCGYDLETDFNIANLSQGTSEEDRHSVSSYCSTPLSELTAICDKGEAYKAVVAKKIKKFSCRFLGNSGKRSLALDGTTLVWSYEYETEKNEGYGDYVAKVLLGLL